MTDTDDGFDEAFKGFGEDPAPVTPPAAEEPVAPTVTPPVTPPVDPPKEEEPKKDEEPAKKPEETPPAPAADEKPKEEETKPPETPAAPATPDTPEEPKPLTKDDVQEVVSNLLNTERSSSKELETTTKEVLDAYYPEGLSNVLTDTNGKELRTPQDVVEASGGKMSDEEAARWLMNEQFKLDKQVADIKESARQIAETTVNFKRDTVNAVQKYQPLFKWQPHLQQKIYDLMMKQVKIDEKKNVVTSAPDILDLYDTYLEPYQKAYEFAHKQPATNATPPPPAPEAPKPTAEDRMDDTGDGGITAPNDPNDFAQQVTKELAN